MASSQQKTQQVPMVAPSSEIFLFPFAGGGGRMAVNGATQGFEDSH